MGSNPITATNLMTSESNEHLQRLNREEDDFLAAIGSALLSLHRKVDRILTEQDNINAVVTDIDNQVAAVASALGQLTQAITDWRAQVQNLLANNPTVDTSGLQASSAKLDAAVANLTALAGSAEPTSTTVVSGVAPVEPAPAPVADPSAPPA